MRKSRSKRTKVRDITKYIITYDQLKFDHVIGTGGYGEVFIGYFIPTGMKVAIKKLYAIDDTQRTKELYQREVEVLASANNRFLLPFVGYTEVHPYCIVTKYIPNGSLYHALHDKTADRKVLSPTEKNLIAYGIAVGMNFLHKREILHRDLKTQNVLLDENYLPIICDFGTSRIKAKSGMTSSFGTPNYMAPEFIQSENYTNSVDVYSFGLILWEMLTDEVPYAGMESAQVIYNVVIQQNRLPIPENVSEHLKDLIESCWSVNPLERPTFKQIVTLFEYGTVEFEGCDREEYQSILSTLIRQLRLTRRHSDANLLANITTNDQITNIQLSRDERTIRSFASLLPLSAEQGNASDIAQKANEYLIALQGNNISKIKKSLEFFELISDNEIILSVDIWPNLLNFFLIEHLAEIQKRAEHLLLKFASYYEMLSNIARVPNLHKFVIPELLDLFLFISDFLPNIIDLQIINKIFEFFNEGEYGLKAISLICRIIQNSPTPSLSKHILDRLKDNLTSYSNTIGGHLMLELCASYKCVKNDTITAFSKSTVETNVISAYKALFSLQEGPELFSLSNILDHCLSTDEELRDVAMEFIRRYAHEAAGEPLMQLVVTLFEAIFQFESEKASLLLCRISSNSKHCVVIVKSGYIDNFLKAKPSTAVILLKVFLTIISADDRCCLFFFQQPLISTFFANVMRAANDDDVVALCWSLMKNEMTADFAKSLVESKFVTLLCEHICKNEKMESQKILWCFGAIARVAPLADCDKYEDVVRLLFDLINSKCEYSNKCNMTLAALSAQVSTHSSMINLNVISMLSRYKDEKGESRNYQRVIIKNLKKSGHLLIP